jgi:hypothetical protein
MRDVRQFMAAHCRGMAHRIARSFEFHVTTPLALARLRDAWVQAPGGGCYFLRLGVCAKALAAAAFSALVAPADPRVLPAADAARGPV